MRPSVDEGIASLLYWIGYKIFISKYFSIATFSLTFLHDSFSYMYPLSDKCLKGMISLSYN